MATFDEAYPIVYKGWDRTAAEANFRDTGGPLKSLYELSGGESGQPQSTADFLRLRERAIQPAVKSLQEQIPEIQQKFGVERSRLEGEKEPLKQRYQTLLDELKRREGKETQTESTNLSREYGKRGIPLSSGVFSQNLSERLNPITEFYGIQGREAGSTYEDNLRNVTNLISGLTGQETDTQRVIKNAIAQLQAGAGNASIDDAFRTLQFMEQQRQADQDLVLRNAAQELEKQRLAISQRPDVSKNYTTLGEGSTLYDLLNGRALYTAPKTYKSDSGGGGNNELDELRKIFNPGNTGQNRYNFVVS